MGGSSRADVRPVDDHVVVTVRPLKRKIFGMRIRILPALLVLDPQGVEQLMDGDLECDAAVLFETNFMPTSSGAIRDDRVAPSVARDDVQVVRLSVALHKPKKENRLNCQRIL